MKSTVEGRLFVVNWCFVATLAAVFLIALAATDFNVQSDLFTMSTAMLLISIALGVLSFILLWTGTPRWPSVAHTATLLSQLGLAAPLILALTYVAAAANYPLQDKNLYAIDQFLGLDWRAYLTFADANNLDHISKIGYSMILWQPCAIIFVVSFTQRSVRGYQFLLASFLAATTTGLISIFLPAVDALAFHGLNPTDYPNLHPAAGFGPTNDLLHLRSGEMRTLHFGHFAGIITFPSFHAASAILALWGFWPVRWMRPVAIVCNGLLLLSTPIDGGHYFIDVIAGITVAVLAIMGAMALARAIERRLPFTGTQTLKQPRQVVAADEPAS